MGPDSCTPDCRQIQRSKARRVASSDGAREVVTSRLETLLHHRATGTPPAMPLSFVCALEFFIYSRAFQPLVSCHHWPASTSPPPPSPTPPFPRPSSFHPSRASAPFNINSDSPFSLGRSSARKLASPSRRYGVRDGGRAGRLRWVDRDAGLALCRAESCLEPDEVTQFSAG